ncbi:hypothetical protein diail_1287 [Diaporthe ilicicola]|nr:hypothetical protein diail_1287 [Diaporthe ilicicola]
MSSDTPDKIELAIGEEVRHLAIQTLLGFPVTEENANRDRDKRVDRINDRLWKGVWARLKPEEQRETKTEVRRLLDTYIDRFDFEAYNMELHRHVAALGIAIPGDAVHEHQSMLAGRLQEEDAPEGQAGEDVFDDPADEQIFHSAVARNRDSAARKKLGRWYYLCKQDLKKVVVKRAKAQHGDMNIDFKALPQSDDKKKRICPGCSNSYSNNAIKRHYQAVHAKDPRKAIFCHLCDHVEWRGDSEVAFHMEKKHGIFLEKGKKKSEGKATQPDASRDDDQEDDQPEEAEEVEGVKGDEAMDDEEMVDEEMVNEEMIDPILLQLSNRGPQPRFAR